MPKRYAKILLCITEDWFALSHFQPLISTLVELADDVVVACRSSGRMGEIERLGARTLEFDFRRSEFRPTAQIDVVRRLVALLRSERPDVVHYIALQTLAVGGIAAHLAPPVPHVLHLTGLGFLGVATSAKARLVRATALRIIGRTMSRPQSWLLTENPDDVATIRAHGGRFGDRFSILGGAGIDEREFPDRPPPDNPTVTAAFVGRLIRTKGVHNLAAAHRLLASRGVPLAISLYGKVDDDNPDGVTREELESWTRQDGVGDGRITWHGHTTDVPAVWTKADIAVLPTLGGEGLPRSALEAAACARPIIASDVPGCRHFVRDGEDGLIVPPGDVEALAAALQRLAADKALRERMGRSARARVLDGFTITHVRAGLRDTYLGLPDASGRRPSSKGLDEGGPREIRAQ